MLSAAHRLRASQDFSEVLRRGTRANRGTVTVHLLPAEAGRVPSDPASHPARAGLVVSKAVGGSVVRHQVARRLRHALQEPVRTLPAGTRLVVRAAPASANASSVVLRADLASALRSALATVERTGQRRAQVGAHR